MDEPSEDDLKKARELVAAHGPFVGTAVSLQESVALVVARAIASGREEGLQIAEPRRPSGKEELIGVQLLPEPLAALDAWIARQREAMSRPEAIRRLVEIALVSASATQPYSGKTAAKAAEIAGHELDRLGDSAATDEERQSRKRKLIKGPAEFRGIRRKPKAKR